MAKIKTTGEIVSGMTLPLWEPCLIVALPDSGQIKLSQLATNFGGSAPLMG